MAAELDEDGEPLFNLASGISLMLFYAFAMQCMSTLAIVKRETNSWKWPMIQLGFMSVFAYIIGLEILASQITLQQREQQFQFLWSGQLWLWLIY